MTTSPITTTVTVFGPNLTSAGQRKGTMHVHDSNCSDCRHYGPGTKYGGEADDYTIPATSRKDIVLDIYADHGADDDSWGDYDDLYLAPCVVFPSVPSKPTGPAGHICPSCHSDKGNPCRTPSGKLTNYHKPRKALAAEATTLTTVKARKPRKRDRNLSASWKAAPLTSELAAHKAKARTQLSAILTDNVLAAVHSARNLSELAQAIDANPKAFRAYCRRHGLKFDTLDNEPLARHFLSR